MPKYTPYSDFADYVPDHKVQEVAEYIWDIGQHKHITGSMRSVIDLTFTVFISETISAYRDEIRCPVGNPTRFMCAMHNFKLYTHSLLYQALERVILLHKIDELI